MPMKVSGISQTVAGLKHLGERVPDNARKAMHRLADNIVKDAKLFTPVDEHNLEESIRKEVTYGYRGRLQIEIVAGGMVNGVNVDQYVARIHENYEALNPGSGTIAKRNANPGVYIGEKFLSRAMTKHRKNANQFVKGRLFRGVKGETAVRGLEIEEE
jgi:hypothetical protein